ncbi:winged helix-turn-helix transcriptional regulator [Planomonospora corallina]|uniref:Winged helix-turn-helix transcriptional regulator n=1 Tax=Planomonospora corallina TaxID=1806052 RepID=A0ABV8I9X9_9ACTN
MAKREFGQYCGLARAVEIVGERWALLIIRDLLVGPRRYTDLRNGLPRIPTNILSARLKEMEAAGVVHRRVLPRPDGSVVYELTDYGRDLEEAVMHLSRWGARSLGEPRPGEVVTPASMVLAMRNTFCPAAATGLNARYEVRMGEVVFHVCVADGGLSAGEGPLPDADLVIETGMAIKALMAGEITPREAVATGAVRIQGDPVLLERFAEAFAI